MPKRVLSVGQCQPDNGALTRFLKSHFDVEVDYTDLPTDTLRKVADTPYNLVLINRKLDADYSDGMDILRSLKDNPATQSIPVMLVTNYAEHQENAVSAGAEYGFGKLAYGDPATVERLKPFLG